jgi:23S rRNA (cytosine1962-C5)-methyltransferase
VSLDSIQAHVGRADFHRLLDSGGGHRLERFGALTVARPDPNALWAPRLPREQWERADAWFHKDRRFGGSHWERRREPPRPWLVRHGPLTLELELTPFKHTGVFPEQEANWGWLARRLEAWRAARSGRRPRVLCLFAYTGAASLACAAAGAEVCHLDASKDVVAWARRNQAHSGLEAAPLRWICDDAGDFLRRELRRGRRYEGLVLDPPAYGRDAKGQVFRFESHVRPLLADCRALLSDEADFLLVNAYSLGYSAGVLGGLLADLLPAREIELGELRLAEEELAGRPARQLPCSIHARWAAGGAA